MQNRLSEIIVKMFHPLDNSKILYHHKWEWKLEWFKIFFWTVSFENIRKSSYGNAGELLLFSNVT